MIASSSPSSSVANTVFDCRVLVCRSTGWRVSPPTILSSPRSWASSDTEVLLLRRTWVRPAFTSFSNTGDGACWRWGNGPFCGIAVVDHGRLDAGKHSSDSVFAMSLSSYSVSEAEWPGPAPTVTRISFARVLPRPARGDVDWERRAARLSTWSSSDELFSSGNYAESRFRGRYI